MSASTPKPKPTVPVALSFEAIDDLIYDARAGDLEALKADISALASQHSCPESHIVASAIDMEDESEGGTGSCVLHFPAANGNIGTLYWVFFISCCTDRSRIYLLICPRNPQRSSSKAL
jgi:hypothetical protein